MVERMDDLSMAAIFTSRADKGKGQKRGQAVTHWRYAQN
jgi:hypothetical protein